MSLPTEGGAGSAALDVERMAPIEVLVGSERFPVIFARAVGGFSVIAGAVTLIAVTVGVPTIPGIHPAGVLLILVPGVVWAGLMFARPQWFPPPAVRAALVTGAVGIPVMVGLIGPRVEVGVVAIAVVGALCPIWVGRRFAALDICILATGYAIVLATRPGYPAPVNRWLVVIGITAAAAGFCAWIIGLVRNLATQERTTHRELEVTHRQLHDAHRQLAELNETLEARVAAQVAEIEALNRLRRFLSRQVAEAVLTAGDEAILQPHRRQIAVFFCDLRGFTTFTGGAEPEEVVEALDAYYNVVGGVLRRHDATVGTFAGDGIMAYLNDPVPCEDPAGTAVQMAMELREPMTGFMDTWRRRGYDLGYGIGIAFGYATLGTIGFEGRNDYTALGSVVNLAARLCGEAASGEVLVDGRTSDALGQRFETVGREVILKGFASPVAAFEVAG